MLFLNRNHLRVDLAFFRTLFELSKVLSSSSSSEMIELLHEEQDDDGVVAIPTSFFGISGVLSLCTSSAEVEELFHELADSKISDWSSLQGRSSLFEVVGLSHELVEQGLLAVTLCSFIKLSEVDLNSLSEWPTFGSSASSSEAMELSQESQLLTEGGFVSTLS